MGRKKRETVWFPDQTPAGIPFFGCTRTITRGIIHWNPLSRIKKCTNQLLVSRAISALNKLILYKNTHYFISRHWIHQTNQSNWLYFQISCFRNYWKQVQLRFKINILAPVETYETLSIFHIVSAHKIFLFILIRYTYTYISNYFNYYNAQILTIPRLITLNIYHRLINFQR